MRRRGFFSSFPRRAARFHIRPALVQRWEPRRHNPIRINFPQRWMLCDLAIEQRLRDRGIVLFAVSVAAIADEVDHHVVRKRGAIFQRDSAHANHCVRIFRIHVENWNRQPLRNIGSETRGLQFRGPRCESDQIVDDDVNGAADGVTRNIRHVQNFGEHALPRERAVAVHGDRQNFFFAAIADPRLLCASTSRCHRVHRFQVAWI